LPARRLGVIKRRAKPCKQRGRAHQHPYTARQQARSIGEVLPLTACLVWAFDGVFQAHAPGAPSLCAMAACGPVLPGTMFAYIRRERSRASSLLARQRRCGQRFQGIGPSPLSSALALAISAFCCAGQAAALA